MCAVVGSADILPWADERPPPSLIMGDRVEVTWRKQVYVDAYIGSDIRKGAYKVRPNLQVSTCMLLYVQSPNQPDRRSELSCKTNLPAPHITKLLLRLFSTEQKQIKKNAKQTYR